MDRRRALFCYEGSRGEFFIILLWIFSKTQISVLNGLEWACFAKCLVMTISEQLYLWFFIPFFKASKRSVCLLCPSFLPSIPYFPFFQSLKFSQERLPHVIVLKKSRQNTSSISVPIHLCCPLLPSKSLSVFLGLEFGHFGRYSIVCLPQFLS